MKNSVLNLMFLLFASMSSLSIFAQRSFIEMKEIAQNKLQGDVELVAVSNKGVKNRPIKKSYSPGSTSDLFYIFNGQDCGFVIVASDENAPAILGYSDDGRIDTENMPDGLMSILELYHDQLSLLIEKPYLSTATEMGSYTPVAPMLKCHFYQDEPYNNLCPTIGGKHAVTGCVATGLAQVLYYWQAPQDSLKGVIEYWGNRGKFDKPDDFPANYKLSGHKFDWSNILPQYLPGQYTKAQADAVADLSLICGLINNMEYGVNESNADLRCVAKRLVENFGMSDRCSTLTGLAFDFKEWQSIVVEELQAGRPVYYAGQKPHNTNSGHCFVLDGLDSNGLVHINWGWNGRSDGYFLLNILNPTDQGIGGSATGEGYGAWNQMVRGLCPKGKDADIPYMFRIVAKMMTWKDPVNNKRSYVGTTNNSEYTFDVTNSKKLDLTITTYNLSTDFDGVFNVGFYSPDNSNTPVKVFSQKVEEKGGPGENDHTFNCDFSDMPSGRYKIVLTSQDKRESKSQPLNFEHMLANNLYVQINDSGYVISKEPLKCPIKCEILTKPSNVHILEGLDTIKVKVTCSPDMDFSDKYLQLYMTSIQSQQKTAKATPIAYYSFGRGTETIVSFYLPDALAEINSHQKKEDSPIKPGDIFGLYISSSSFNAVCSDTVQFTVLDSEIPTGKKTLELTLKVPQEQYCVNDTIHYTLHMKGYTYISKQIQAYLDDMKGHCRGMKSQRISVRPDTDESIELDMPTKDLAPGDYMLYIVDINSMLFDYSGDVLTNKVKITLCSPTSIENVQGSDFNVQGVIYNLAGQRVGADYKGIVIVNGKKVLK